MTEAQLYEAAYNAHERAEQAALAAMAESLRGVSLDALACLADPEWGWINRSSISGHITDWASEVLDEKLEALVA
jgi:hypothetical protein